MHVIRFFFLETTRIEKINNFSRIRGGISHREVPIDQLNDTKTVFIPIQIQFIHAIFISRFYHRLSTKKGRKRARWGGKLKEETEEDFEDTIGGEETTTGRRVGWLGEGGRKNYRSVEVGGPRKREGGGATRCQENRPGENKLNLAE